MKRQVAVNKKIKKIARILNLRSIGFLGVCNFSKALFCSPYCVIMGGSLDSNNIFFLNKLLHDYGGVAFSTISAYHFNSFHLFNFLLTSKHLVTFSFTSLMDLKKFIQVITSNLYTLNKQKRFDMVFIKLHTNTLYYKFFDSNFSINTNKRKLIRKIMKANLYSFKLCSKLYLQVSSYFVCILKTLYFYMILCRQYTK